MPHPPAIAATPTDGDAEIIALAEKIERIKASAEEISEERVAPFDERFDQILYDGWSGTAGVTDKSVAAAFVFS